MAIPRLAGLLNSLLAQRHEVSCKRSKPVHLDSSRNTKLAQTNHDRMDRGLFQVTPVQVLEELEPDDWTHLSAGKGSKEPRSYDQA